MAEVGFCGLSVGASRRLLLDNVSTLRYRPRQCRRRSSADLTRREMEVTQVLFGPLFETLNTSSPEWFRTLVWGDFRLAVLFFVFYPLFLLFGSVNEPTDSLKRVMIGYWQASSLLMLTVFLNIAEQPVGTFTALFVQIMIPISIWWWKDLVNEIEETDSFMHKAFLWWRWPATALSIAGAVTQLTQQSCNFAQPLQDPFCAAWLEPPFNFYRLLISYIPVDAVKFLGYGGAAIYFGYLSYYIAVPLQRAGRDGRKEREAFSSVSLLRSWGWLAAPPSQDNKGE